MVSTYILPAVHTLPTRAFLITPSNLIPTIGPEHIFDEAIFSFYKFHVTKISYGTFEATGGTSLDGNSKNAWYTVEQFTGSQVLRGQIRHVGHLVQPENMTLDLEDRVYIACVKKLNQSEIYRLVLPIVYNRIKIVVAQTEELLLTIVQSFRDELTGIEYADRIKLISSQNIQVTVHPDEADTNIFFTITKATHHGHLFLSNADQTTFKDRLYVGVNFRFNQSLVKEGRLFYIFRRTIEDNPIFSTRLKYLDAFEYRVHVPGSKPSRTYHFPIEIRFIPFETLSSMHQNLLHINVKTIFVNEDGMSTIDSDILFVSNDSCFGNVQSIGIELHSSPNFGSIRLDMVKLRQFQVFCYKSIKQGRLFYAHRGSEYFKDTFQLRVACLRSCSQSDTHFSERIIIGRPVLIELNVRVNPINDHIPKILTKPLTIRTRNATLIPSGWLTVIDRDGGSLDPERLQITWKVIHDFQRHDLQYPEVGCFADVTTNVCREHFAVDDIDNEMISFVHLGSPKPGISFTVSDEKFSAESNANLILPDVSLEIVAPDIVEVIEGRRTYIFFDILLNIQVDPTQIYIRLLEPPCLGSLISDIHPGELNNFTYNQILGYQIFYQPYGYRNSTNGKCLRKTASNPQSENSPSDDFTGVVNIAATQGNLSDKAFTIRLLYVKTDLRWINYENGPILPEVINLEVGKSFIFDISDKFDVDSRRLRNTFECTEHPKSFRFCLTTPSFKLCPVVRFTSLDLLSKRVSIEHQRANSFEHHDTAEQARSEECVAVKQEKSGTFTNDSAEVEHLMLCVAIWKTGVNLKAHNLVVQAEKECFLSDAGIQTALFGIARVRNDQPFNWTDYDVHVGDDHNFSESNIATTPQRDTEISTIFFIEQIPRSGKIMSRRLGKEIRLFTNVDLVQNDTYYKPQAVLDNGQDLIKVSALDAIRNMTTKQPLLLKFTSSNRIDRLTMSRNYTQDIIFGSYTYILTDCLQATGGNLEGDGGQIEYRINAVYSGYLSASSKPGFPITRFKQAEVDRKAIVFHHHIDQRNEDACGFDFYLISGLAKSGPHLYRFVVRNVTLQVSHNNPLRVFPTIPEDISRWHLETQLVDTSHAQFNIASDCVVNMNMKTSAHSNVGSICCQSAISKLSVHYTILKTPEFGGIFRKRNHTKSDSDSKSNSVKVSWFTQNMINNGQIFYQLGASAADLHLNHSAKEKLIINVSMALTELQVPLSLNSLLIDLHILISFEYVTRWNVHRLIHMSPVFSPHEGLVQIGRDNIDPSELLRSIHKINRTRNAFLEITHLPLNGILQINGKKSTSATNTRLVFHPDYSPKILYKNFRSGVKIDRIMFTFGIGNSTCDHPTCSIQLPIILQSQEIVDNYSVNSNIREISSNFELLAGEFLYLQINHLLPQMEPFATAYLNITISSEIKFGNLYFMKQTLEGGTSKEFCPSSCTFSVTQLHSRTLVYQSYFNPLKSSLLELFTVFYSQVKHSIIIDVKPSKLVIFSSEITLTQGSRLANVDNEMINVRLVGEKYADYGMVKHDICYEIIENSNVSQLLYDTVPVSQFCNNDLQFRRLFYEHMKMNEKPDCFIVRATIRELNQIRNPIIRSISFPSIANRISNKTNSLSNEFQLCVRVRPLVSFRQLVTHPNTLLQLNSTAIFSSERQLVQHAPKSAIFSFPMGARLRTGRFRSRNMVLTSSIYPDGLLSTEVNLTLHEILSGNIQFETYSSDILPNDKMYLYEELVTYNLFIDEGPPVSNAFLIQIVNPNTQHNNHTIITYEHSVTRYNKPISWDHENVSMFIIVCAVCLGLSSFALLLFGLLCYKKRVASSNQHSKSLIRKENENTIRMRECMHRAPDNCQGICFRKSPTVSISNRGENLSPNSESSVEEAFQPGRTIIIPTLSESLEGHLRERYNETFTVVVHDKPMEHAMEMPQHITQSFTLLGPVVYPILTLTEDVGINIISAAPQTTEYVVNTMEHSV